MIEASCARCVLVAVSLLRNLKHANIVTLHDIIHTNHSLTIVFEYLVCSFLACSVIDVLVMHCVLKQFHIHRLSCMEQSPTELTVYIIVGF